MKRIFSKLIFLSLMMFSLTSNATLVTFDFTARVTSTFNISGTELDGLSQNDVINGSITYENDVPITYTNTDGWIVQSVGQFSNVSTFTVNAGSFSDTVQLEKLEIRNDKPEQDSNDDGDYLRFDTILTDNNLKRFALRLWDQMPPLRNDAVHSLLVEDVASSLIFGNFSNSQVFISADGGNFAASILSLSVNDQPEEMPTPAPLALLGLGLAAIGFTRKRKA